MSVSRRILIVLLAVAAFSVGGFWVVELIRTSGYTLVWMDEGVIPYGHHPLNNAGEVAVDINRDEELEGLQWVRAARWSIADQPARELGRLPGAHPCSQVSAINDEGNIVGTVPAPLEPIGWNPASRAFFWSEQTGMLELPKLSNGQIMPSAINNKNEVVGSTPVADGPWRAFLWKPGDEMRPLELIPKGLIAFGVAINERSWIIGNCQTEDGTWHAVLWKPGSPVRDLGVPVGYTEATAQRMNDRGEILVECTKPQSMLGDRKIRRPFLWTEERGYSAVPVPQGYDEVDGRSINNRGDVLIRAMAGGWKDRDFLVNNGELIELPKAQENPTTSYFDVNDKGWLVGFIYLEGGNVNPNARRRGFLLKPGR